MRLGVLRDISRSALYDLEVPPHSHPLTALRLLGEMDIKRILSHSPNVE